MAVASGIIPLYKPKGMTSHDCVNKIRKMLHIKKVGHTGTLDPNVDGVLPICINRATKIVPYLLEGSKAYTGIISLGTSTTTEDMDGDIVTCQSVQEPFSKEEVESVFRRFTGTIRQVPPMYSAVKVNGRRLYEYAREGIDVERPKRDAFIYALELLGTSSEYQTEIPFRVHCSKGTYVRTLGVDIGQSLGYPAHLQTLTRTHAANISLQQCLTFEDINELVDDNPRAIDKELISIGDGLSMYPSMTVTDEMAAKVRNGGLLKKPEDFQKERITIYNRDGLCLAIYHHHPKYQHLLKPERVFAIDE
ncbi:tRNA pseudouridine(55) synthase TruB [Tuberibacillus sp. Marseille-P3662]|uniref:tRNA pseudouridine(55) synthase TruB n=1 Tax=Tuberibacillus sp. Marseille-P3662 TaxID=1965358 RepID=UPI000A1CB8D1|nr:tRNA pseudouridine(55) synthase TruB [Tuberibacillus sp. Marseille-P3662]